MMLAEHVASVCLLTYLASLFPLIYMVVRVIRCRKVFKWWRKNIIRVLDLISFNYMKLLRI
jgi:hypothetical protein